MHFFWRVEVSLWRMRLKYKIWSKVNQVMRSTSKTTILGGQRTLSKGTNAEEKVLQQKNVGGIRVFRKFHNSWIYRFTRQGMKPDVTFKILQFRLIATRSPQHPAQLCKNLWYMCKILVLPKGINLFIINQAPMIQERHGDSLPPAKLHKTRSVDNP